LRAGRRAGPPRRRPARRSHGQRARAARPQPRPAAHGVPPRARRRRRRACRHARGRDGGDVRRAVGRRHRHARGASLTPLPPLPIVPSLSATNHARRRVAVTGLGLVTPLGCGIEPNWAKLVAGRSGIGPITRFNASGLPARVAGEVRGFEPERYMERKDLKKMDIFIQYALAAAQMAVEDAGLPSPVPVPERTGVIVGVGMGGIASLEDAYLLFAAGNLRRVSPFFIPKLIPNMASGHIALRIGARGPNYATTSACASGAHAIGECAVLIRDGRQDVMLAGGAEAPICLLGVGGFSAMRALATNFNDEPTRASRPFDARRDGFVIAEGAGVLVLEELEHARRRGAHVYAELVGYGATCDAYHMTQPPPERAGAAECMRHPLHDPRIQPRLMRYINP